MTSLQPVCFVIISFIPFDLCAACSASYPFMTHFAGESIQSGVGRTALLPLVGLLGE
jgi:hypothetical protein